MIAYRDCFKGCKNLKFKYKDSIQKPDCGIISGGDFTAVQYASCPFYNKGWIAKIKEFMEVSDGDFLLSKKRSGL